MKTKITIALLLLISVRGIAQTQTKDSILLTGIVLESDSLKPLAITHFIINNEKGGITDENGHFYFWAHIGDTIMFSYVGYKTVRVVLEDTLPSIDYLLGIQMTMDTIPIKEVVIYPRIVGDINTLMANTNVESRNQENAANNIRFATYQGLTQTPKEMDAEMSQKRMIEAQNEQNINKGLISSDQMINYTALIPLSVLAINRLAKGKKTVPRLSIEEESKIRSLFRKDVEVE